MDICYTKSYADASVQTSPTGSATHVLEESPSKVIPTSHDLKRVTYVDETMPGSCSDSSVVRRVYPRTPVNRMKTHLPFNLHHKLSNPSVAPLAQRRVVSFPEQLRQEVLSERLANSFIAGSRSVSMPAAIQHFPQVEASYEGSPTLHQSQSQSFSFEDQEYSTCHSYSRARDLPLTPSLPSTPDSIEIIDNSFQFSDAFLQTQVHQVHGAKGTHKDWLTWANSPPRPIPALHGPASLPYARCPSGAEGTLIEEPSTVPGLIWGLRDSVNESMQYCEDDRGNAVIRPRMARVLKVPPHVSSRPATEKDQEGTVSGGIELLHAYEKMKAKHQTMRTEGVECDRESPHEGIFLETSQSSTANSLPFNSMSNKTYEQATVTHCNQRSFYEASHSLVDAKHSQNNDNLCLDACAPAFIPNQLRGTFNATQRNDSQKKCFTNGLNIPLSDNSMNHPLDLRPEHMYSSLQHTLPTPPNSTPSLWSCELPVALDDSDGVCLDSFEAHCGKPNLQYSSLYLRVNPESLEDLSDRLGRLILQQQQNYICVNHGTGHPPSSFQKSDEDVAALRPRPRSMTASYAPSLKPAMPINLQDLVTRRTPTYQSTTVNPDPLPIALLTIPPLDSAPEKKCCDPQSAPVAANDVFPTLPSTKENYRVGRGDVLSGRRHPKSIPLFRLLEKKLAPVPEETSFISNNSESPLTAIHDLPTSASQTSHTIKKDFDFTEVRYPTPETGDKLHNFQGELSGPSLPERKIAGSVKQKRQQVKLKLPENTSHGRKIVGIMPNGRRNAPTNDDRLNLPTVASTPRKKSRIKQIGETAKAQHGISPRIRRKDH